jgi:uncharacterized protein YndB with AHSA1/START domain
MMEATDSAVRREIVVAAPPERAFAVFTERIDTWWPRGYTIGAAELEKVVIEPREGGRFYEAGVDGCECVWGEVLVYEPPSRIVLTWRIAGDWQLDEAASEVEVTFTPAGDGTRVELEHRHFERLRLGDAMREQVGGDGGWGGLLVRYSEAVG